MMSLKSSVKLLTPVVHKVKLPQHVVYVLVAVNVLVLGLDLQLGISKAESGSRFEKNSPPEVLTVVTGSIRHRSRRSWSCSTEI